MSESNSASAAEPPTARWERGSFGMIRENYIKLSIGLSLFGEDDWFKRFKYQ